MQLTIEMNANWELIEPTGDLMRRAAVLALGEGALADQILVTGRELLENTVKYSRTGDASIGLCIKDGSVRICVENEPDPSHVQALRNEIDKLGNLTDTLDHYLERMAIAAKSETGKSGLGLARIRHECGMTLSVETAGARVRICATRSAASGNP